MNQVCLDQYKGKVLLIVNVASKCGFSPQYGELQEIYERYKEQGFEVLAFPCSQFLNQEFSEEQQICEFVKTKFNVTFPLFAKVNVNGSKADPLFKYLKKHTKGSLGIKTITWNFTKFLVDTDGMPVKRYQSYTTPLSLEKDIKELLKPVSTS
ncbi:hypothetical protein AKO1_007959 [Acrasis kona]|uniref:Glutathione peroxidase n=1 Tax=Acrasis kona TaxID=1008807 RepID=A0AAW2YQD6_9EUKA